MMLWRFRRLIDLRGADPARWPPAERAAAVALLAHSPRARAALAAAQRLDRLLEGGAMIDAADEALAARIVARATALPQDRRNIVCRIPAGRRRSPAFAWPRLWPQAAGLAAAAVLGFIVGVADLLPPALGGAGAVDLSDFVDLGGAGLEEPL